MEAVHVACLRGICARYIEGHVAPVLQELLRSQQVVETQLEAVTRAAVRRTEHSEAEARLKELVASCTAELAGLATKVEQLESTRAESALGAGTSLEELRRVLEEDFASKADLSEVPTLEQFNELSSEVERKANIGQVPAATQLQRLSEKVDRKANTSKVPTLSQFQELSAVVESKANIQYVPTVSEFEDFCGTVERKISACSLVNPAQIQRMSAALERKADLDQVPTCSRVEKVDALVKTRAAAAEVPTLAEFRALASRVAHSEQDLKQQQQAHASLAAASTANCNNNCQAVAPHGQLQAPNSPVNGLGQNAGGVPQNANVVWLVPAAMGDAGQWDNGYSQQNGCNGMWSPQGADCHQQWRPQNGINGHQHQQLQQQPQLQQQQQQPPQQQQQQQPQHS